MLAVICAVALAVIVVLGTRLSFFSDDWNFLLVRPGLEGSSLFVPHNGQLVVGVDLTFKTLVALFGYAQLPFRLTLGIAVAGVGVAVYVLVAERVGWILALASTAVVVFLGTAWEDLLFFASIGPVVALATGLGALYLLERDSPGRNSAACALVVVSVAFSGVGLAFVVAVAVAVLLRGRPAQMWIPGLPAVLYGIWTLWKGESTSNLSLANLEHLPRYMFESASIGLASVTGVNHGAHALLHGEVLLTIALGIAAVWIYRGGRPSRWIAVLISAALAFWALTGLSFVPGREPVASRYQLVDAALLLVIAAELFRPVRLRPVLTAAVVAAAALVVVSNAFSYRSGYRFLRDQSEYAKAEIGAFEIARGHTNPATLPNRPLTLNPYLVDVTPARYYHETSKHGKIPHLSPAAISVASEPVRRTTDAVLAGTYRMLVTTVERATSGRVCSRFAAGDGPAGLELRPGLTRVTNLGANQLTVLVGRFSSPEMPVPLGFLPSGSSRGLDVPRDGLLRPWRLTIEGRSPGMVCLPPASRLLGPGQLLERPVLQSSIGPSSISCSGALLLVAAATRSHPGPSR
jgi:hypothetical protein